MTSVFVLLAGLASASSVSSATLVAAPSSPAEGCPNARQVTEAMQSRLPNSVVPTNELLWPAQREIVRAVLEVAPDGSLVRFFLVNGRGETQLRRTLSVASPGRANECQALAETLAAIVERYLDFPTFEASDALDADGRAIPPGSGVAGAAVDPSRRLFSLFAGIAGRMGFTASTSDFEGRVGGQLDLVTRPLRIGILASAGIAGARYATTQGVDATLRRFPVRLGGIGELSAGPGAIQPMVELGLDWTWIDASSRSKTRAIPVVSGAIAYRLDLGKRLFVRAFAGGGVSLVPYDVAVGDLDHVAFRTPRSYLQVGVETGYVFR